MKPSSGGRRTSVGVDRVAGHRSDAALVEDPARVTRIEFVGLAGVGKSHLARRLFAWYGDRAVEHSSVTPSWSDLPALPRTIGELAPLLLQVLRSGGSSAAVRIRFCRRLLVHAWRDAVITRSMRGQRVVIDEEGWFHKLRQLRRVMGSDIAFADLPESVSRRHFDADLVLLLTADPAQICARKLRRKGKRVTPETLAQQYADSAALGQWDELARTRHDLEQAAALRLQRFVEIDYGESFDFDRDVVSQLRRFELA